MYHLFPTCLPFNMNENNNRKKHRSVLLETPSIVRALVTIGNQSSDIDVRLGLAMTFNNLAGHNNNSKKRNSNNVSSNVTSNSNTTDGSHIQMMVDAGVVSLLREFQSSRDIGNNWQNT